MTNFQGLLAGQQHCLQGICCPSDRVKVTYLNARLWLNWLEQRFLKPRVAGSSPAGRTNF